MLTVRRLRETLHYNPETGVFIWIQPASNRVQAGMEAGRIHEVCGYRQIGVDGRRYQAHRLAWLYMTEEWPSDMIDHINCDRADNRFSNLRESCNSDNVKNRRKAGSQNKTGMLGVTAIDSGFRARIQQDGKNIHLGVFDTAEEAHIAYKSAANKYRSHLLGAPL